MKTISETRIGDGIYLVVKSMTESWSQLSPISMPHMLTQQLVPWRYDMIDTCVDLLITPETSFDHCMVIISLAHSNKHTWSHCKNTSAAIVHSSTYWWLEAVAPQRIRLTNPWLSIWTPCRAHSNHSILTRLYVSSLRPFWSSLKVLSPPWFGHSVLP